MMREGYEHSFGTAWKKRLVGGMVWGMGGKGVPCFRVLFSRFFWSVVIKRVMYIICVYCVSRAVNTILYFRDISIHLLLMLLVCAWVATIELAFGPIK